MTDRILAETPFLRLVDRDGWSFVERPRGVGVVTIVAVTPDARLLLVEQERRPLGGPTIELPAGLVGDEPGRQGEPFLDAARRELREETGYEADEWKALPTCATSPGMTSELVAFFLARRLRKVSAGGGVGSERIQVHEVPLATLDAWLRERAAQGTPIAAKVYAGLYLLGAERSTP